MPRKRLLALSVCAARSMRTVLVVVAIHPGMMFRLSPEAREGASVARADAYRQFAPPLLAGHVCRHCLPQFHVCMARAHGVCVPGSCWR